MPLSNSTDYNQTALQIITDALTLIGVLRPGGTASTNDVNFCLNLLNKMIKSWSAKGIHMWVETEGTLFLRDGVNQYTLSSTASDQSGDNSVETTLSSVGSSGSTVLVLTDTTGMTASDNIGIELDDNTRQWTTIISVDSSTQVTVQTALTGDAASGNTVFSYTTHSGKALSVSSARLKDNGDVETPLLMRGRDDFMTIPYKSITGRPNTICYVSSISSGTFYVFPTPDQCYYRIKFSYQQMIEDLDSSSDNLEFPSEWLETITLNLAALIGTTYGKVGSAIAEIRQMAQQSLLDMQMFDVDSGSIFIVPYDDESH